MPDGAAAALCPACHHPLRPAATFCSACGHSLVAGVAAPARREQRAAKAGFAENWDELKKLSWLFGILVASSFVYGLAQRWNPSPWGMVLLAAFDAAVVLVAVAMRFPRLRFLFAVYAVPPAVLVRLALASGGFIAATLLYFWLLGRLGLPFVSVTREFAAHGWPVWAMLALVSLAPALVEELAFRGVIQSSLERIFNRRDAWLIQAALFSVLHLSPAIFPSHFLMGLWFGLLRMHTRSIYPAMAVHAVWNALVLAEELYG